MATELAALVQQLGHPRVLVLGDVMLDRYIWGDTERISQEAPVILLQANWREERLGGASSVAAMLAALGAQVMLASITGNDVEGIRIRQILESQHIQTSALFTDDSRPTTVKERYMGRAQHRHPQQMLRVDYELRAPINSSIESTLALSLAKQIQQADIVLVSDYDKGVCTPSLLRTLIAQCQLQGVPVLIDPARGTNFSKYSGCTALTPNRLETKLALGAEIRTINDAINAARKLRENYARMAAIVTLDKDGMAVSSADGDIHIPTRPRQVYDITGAGDMVLATLGLALAANVELTDAVRLANAAGGLEVERIGVTTITRDELIADLLRSHTPSKLLDEFELIHELNERRRAGHRIAFTNGCFDILHAGHVQYLREARAQADLLIVALNSDSSVKHLKGPTRPIHDVESRVMVLSELQAVDYVIVFDEPTPQRLIERIQPDVLVKGADYERSEIVGADFVESYGGRVHRAPIRPGLSTTSIIRKNRAA